MTSTLLSSTSLLKTSCGWIERLPASFKTLKMNSSSELIRTYVRSLFATPKQKLLVDALLKHSVLTMDDLTILLQSQPKDIRALINPLRSSRLVSVQSRASHIVPGANRPSTREYYYINFHEAIDAIKYKIARLRKSVENLYQTNESTKLKEWRCPRCKAEYDTNDILDKQNDEQGFYCDRCGGTLVQIDEAAQSNMDRSMHEKIRRLNDQLKKFDALILKIDKSDVPENDFATAWDRRKHVPRPPGSHMNSTDRTTDGSYSQDPFDPSNPYSSQTSSNALYNSRKGQELVDTKNLAVNLTTGDEEEREEAERKKKRKQELARAISYRNGTPASTTAPLQTPHTRHKPHTQTQIHRPRATARERAAPREQNHTPTTTAKNYSSATKTTRRKTLKTWTCQRRPLQSQPRPVSRENTRWHFRRTRRRTRTLRTRSEGTTTTTKRRIREL